MKKNKDKEVENYQLQNKALFRYYFGTNSKQITPDKNVNRIQKEDFNLG